MKTVLVTGATGMLGKYVCEELSDGGFDVLRVSRSAKQETEEILDKTKRTIAVDLEGEDGLSNFIDRIPQDIDDIYGFVHLARSSFNLLGPDAPRSSWLREFELATYVPYRVSLHLRDGFGLQRVILAGSIYGQVAQKPGLYANESSLNPHYGASKAAANQVARDLAVRFAPSCQVNTISWGGISSGSRDDVELAYSAQNPSGRMLSLKEAYEPIDFLLSPGASGITGQDLVVDGGWTTW